MRDCDVRSALHQRLAEDHRSEQADTLFVDELGLCGRVRVDVAVVNGSLSGFELKSARDTLKRLPEQVIYYSRVLDFATLVVANNHAKAAMELLPAWWGVIEARWGDDGVELVEHRQAVSNENVDPLSLAQLLWREEVLAELETRGAAAGVRSKPRQVLWQRLVDSVSLDELRDVVRIRLKSREDWRPAR